MKDIQLADSIFKVLEQSQQLERMGLRGHPEGALLAATILLDTIDRLHDDLVALGYSFEITTDPTNPNIV